MPANIVLDTQVTFVTDPVQPCAGQDFTASWQEKNTGDEASGQYQDTFDFDDQGSGNSQALTCDPLDAGQSAMRSLTFNLPAGNYTMTLVINAGAPLTLGNVIIDECN
jgi:CARDB